jgi:hypothetical protein
MFRRLAAWAVLVVSAGSVAAQTGPQLATVFPPGATPGESVDVTVSGSDFDSASQLLFSDPSAKAEFVGVSVGPDPKTKQPPGMVVGTPATAKFKVIVPKEGSAGVLDVRIVTKTGLSNPRAFVVGSVTEVNEKEPNNDTGDAQKVELNTTVNGVISAPTDVDYFSFRAKAGQNVVVYCLTTTVDSKLQADLMVIGSGGKVLAANHGYRGGDAVLDFLPPADGEYLVRVSQFAYTSGGPDHFYRLTITTGPWCDAMFPPIWSPDIPAHTILYGRNLQLFRPKPNPLFPRPDGRPFDADEVCTDFGYLPLELFSDHPLTPAQAALDGGDYPVAAANRPFVLGTQRESGPVSFVLDNGDNDTPEKAQPVKPPCDVAGRIEKKNDRDWYVFEAKKGEVWTLEVFADRIGSPVDAYFILTDEKGKVIVEVDDGPDSLSPNQFYTKSDDPARYRFAVPADGKYRVMVSTREAGTQFGVRDQYVLRIARENPDFRFAVMPPATHFPDAGTLPKNGAVLFNVYVFRFDGFDGPITLTAENLPPGVSCPPQVIGSGQSRGTLVLTADTDAEDWAGFVRITGTSEKLSHTARPFTVVWPIPGLPPNQPLPPNIPMIARMDRGPGLALAVRGEAPFRLIAKNDEPIRVKPGGKIEITLKVERKDGFKDQLQLFCATPNVGPRQQPNNPVQPPVGAVAPAQDEVKVSLDTQPNVAAGTYSVVLVGRSGVPPKGPQARPAPSYPSVPITVIVDKK